MKRALVGISQLVTLAGPARPRVGPEMRQLGVISDGAALIENGRFVRVGARSEVEPLIGPDTEVVDCGGRIVLPGFVDAHTHLVFSGNRLEDYVRRIAGQSYSDISADGGGIMTTVRATRAASEDQLLWQAIDHARWMLEGGTTTAECKSGYGLDLETELRILRTVRRVGEGVPLKAVATFLGAHALPPEHSDSDAYVTQIMEEMLPLIASEGLAEFCDAFCEEGYFSKAQCRRLLMRAKDLGFGIRLHVDQLTNGGGASLAAELGAATADHLEQADMDGIRALARAGVQPVLLPGSVYALGLHHYPAARAMIDAGLAVVVATDFNPGSSPSPSIPMAMSLACVQMKMQPSEALTSCTINAAYSLGRGHSVGSIETGKQADFVIWDCADFREIPYYFGRSAVHQVFVDGVSAFTR